MGQINAAGLALIKHFESLQLKAYKDAVGIWTIGYGHTGPDVHAGQEITETEADELLMRDLSVAEDAVCKLVSVPLLPGQFDALVSFTFNLGVGTFRGSTLRACVNRGDHAAAAKEFGKWIFATGRKLTGLIARREAEAQLYQSAIV